MPRLTESQLPSYRLHKQSGQAIVTLSGEDHLLGRHGSAESKKEFSRLISEWLANGRRPIKNRGLIINELILAYWRHAKQYYRKDGQPTREPDLIRYALKPVKDLYGEQQADEFGPLSLRAVQEKMIAAKWSRKNINKQIIRVKGMFKWGVSREIIPSSVYHGLQTVDGLKRGRTDARETQPVKPVSDQDLNAVIATLSHSLSQLMQLQAIPERANQQRREHLDKQIETLAVKIPWESPVAAMVYVQRLTGMRSGELVIMRACDIDMSSSTWTYAPASHKTQHHGRSRTVALGPRVQPVLQAFLTTDVQAFLFSPQNALKAKWRWLRGLRKSKVQPSQVDRSKPLPKIRPGIQYTTATYRRAVCYACKRAGVAAWHPHQLRHAFATQVRRELGIEAARAALGHTSSAVTEIYAELDKGLSTKVAASLG